jgi:hypothetical protein
VQALTFRTVALGEYGFWDLTLFGMFLSVVRQSGIFREETSMSKDAQDKVVLTEDARRKLEECVAALAACGFGEDGPPVETTFAEIEEFGHKVGRLLARSVDQSLTSQHAEHFRDESNCPGCGHRCGISEGPETRMVQTTDGNVPIQEPICHCPVCNRDFFPSADRVED